VTSWAFVDTNVLVYASEPTSAFWAAASAALLRLEAAGDTLCISRQIVREYIAVVTRPQAGMPPLPPASAAASARRLLEIYAVLEDTAIATARLLELLETVSTAGRQVHDANIVATMLAHGVTRLLTFNTADFRRFTPAIELVPIAG